MQAPPTKRLSALQIDPSRTASERRAFLADVNLGINRIKKTVYDWVYKEDNLALDDAPGALQLNARAYQFQTSAKKLSAFDKWLGQMLEGGILGEEKAGKYITSAYKKGLNRAYAEAKKGKLSEASRSFILESFGASERRDTIEFLATRTFNEMQGVSQAMKRAMNRTLAQGMAEGKGARAIARDLVADVEGLGKSRAMTVARTELAAAQSEGQLDGFEDLGLDEIDMLVEWSTAEDGKVCARCISAAKKGPYTIEEARGLIPLHPNCRCAWIPAEPGTKKKKKRKKKPTTNALRAIRPSVYHWHNENGYVPNCSCRSCVNVLDIITRDNKKA